MHAHRHGASGEHVHVEHAWPTACTQSIEPGPAEHAPQKSVVTPYWLAATQKASILVAHPEESPVMHAWHPDAYGATGDTGT